MAPIAHLVALGPAGEVVPVRVDSDGHMVTADHETMELTPWSYTAASGGILNSTANVTLVGAGGAGVINYLDSLQIYADALGVVTEIVVTNGASGAVLWRHKISVAGLKDGLNVVFKSPLRSSQNTALVFAAVSATLTGAIYVNAQGRFGVW